MIHFLKTYSFTCRFFALSISFLAATIAIYLCIELPIYIRYQREISTKTSYFHTTKQRNQHEIETILKDIQSFEKRAQKCEKIDYHKTYYIRFFTIPCSIRKILYIQQNMHEQLPKPVSLGAWLSAIEESEYEEVVYEIQNEKQKIDELQDNGFMLQIYTLVWRTENNEWFGIPEYIEIEFEGLPTLQTTLSLRQHLNLGGVKIPKQPYNDWFLWGATYRIWLQFENRPIPECLYESIQEGRLGLINLPKDFPRSMQELSGKESKVRIQSQCEDTRLSIQYDLSPVNCWKDKQ